MHYTRTASIAGVVLVVGGTAGVLLLFDPRVHILDVAAFSVGIGVMILGGAALCAVFNRVAQPVDDAYKRGFSVGHDQGHAEGRMIARPVIVPIVDRRKCCTHCSNAQPPKSCKGGVDRRGEASVS